MKLHLPLLAALTFWAAPALAAAIIARLVNRLTWGPAANGDATERHEPRSAWLDRQLHPSADDVGLPPAVQAQIDALEMGPQRAGSRNWRDR